MISATDRLSTLELINEAKANGASLSKACKEMGIDEQTYFRWIKKLKLTGIIDDLRPTALRPPPTNKISFDEEEQILKVANSPEFADCSPKQIVPKLADQGIYIASESTIYRVLHKHSICHHRRKGKVHGVREVPTHSADAPNQVWMWDITYLPGPIKGTFYFLYLISDLFSRYVVGWEVWLEQTAEHASMLVSKAHLAGHIKPGDTLVIHSDNGSPMKGSTMLATLQSLGIVASFSRPRVSNDNAFAESLFSTFKSRPSYNGNGFASLDDARQFVASFVAWYNNEHYHSGICYLTPVQRHRGNWRAVLKNRTEVYEKAKSNHPERWNNRPVRNWSAPDVVYLNPVKDKAGAAKAHPAAKNDGNEASSASETPLKDA